MKGLIFVNFLNNRSKGLTMQINFHSLLWFTKGTNNPDHVCVCVCVCVCVYIYLCSETL